MQVEDVLEQIPAAPRWVRADNWTLEQQRQEAQRRFLFMKLMYANEEIKFAPRPNDVIVTTTPKSGTTWLTHICHQLRMQGCDPDFDTQDEVITFIGIKLFHFDPDAKLQPASPRIFATHMPGPLVPRGGKIITCFREPKDVVLSACRFYDYLLAFRGRVSMEILSWAVFNIGRVKDVLDYILYWWEHRHDQDVLLLFFDDLIEDHVGCVRRIAKFIGVDSCSEEVIDRVVFTTTHAEMVKHQNKFMTPKVVCEMAELLGEAAPCKHDSRVRKNGGKTGEGDKVLPKELRLQIEKDWEEFVGASLGFKNLDEMRQSWKNELL